MLPGRTFCWVLAATAGAFALKAATTSRQYQTAADANRNTVSLHTRIFGVDNLLLAPLHPSAADKRTGATTNDVDDWSSHVEAVGAFVAKAKDAKLDAVMGDLKKASHDLLVARLKAYKLVAPAIKDARKQEEGLSQFDIDKDKGKLDLSRIDFNPLKEVAVDGMAKDLSTVRLDAQALKELEAPCAKDARKKDAWTVENQLELFVETTLLKMVKDYGVLWKAWKAPYGY
jgi:hypothetical protein